jgi:hypothetical protein
LDKVGTVGVIGKVGVVGKVGDDWRLLEYLSG